MLTEFEINNFKKFSTLKLTNLSRINLFFGKNNVGKTTLLEAIFAYACGDNVSAFVNGVIPHRMPVGQQDNPYQTAELILNMFHQPVNEFKFSLKGKYNSKYIDVIYKFSPSSLFSGFIPDMKGIFQSETTKINQAESQNQFQLNAMGLPFPIQKRFLGDWSIKRTDHSKEIQFPMEYPNAPKMMLQEPLIPAQMHDILAHQNESTDLRIYASLARFQLLDKIVDEMNNAFEGLNVVSIENIPYPNGSQAPLSCRFSDGTLLPLYTLGDGVRRWYHIIGSMILLKDAIHCIEEVDVNFHHKAQNTLSLQLYKCAEKYQSQIFATSNNKEYLQTFLESFNESAETRALLADEIRIITLRDVDGTMHTRTLNGEDALWALQNGLELRV